MLMSPIASVASSMAICALVTALHAADDQAPDVPDAVIDLRTPAGAALVGGAWRFTDAHIVDADFHAPGPDNKPTGAAVRTHDIHPRVGTPDFENAPWQVIEADTLESRRTNGRLAFGWYRLTLTIPVLNNARNVLFVAQGSDKAPAVKTVLGRNSTADPLPAQLIQPSSGSTAWFLDRQAAQELESDAGSRYLRGLRP